MTEASGSPARVIGVNPDRLAELEEERRFLLRSIADLDRERAAGDVEPDDYEALRDGYTARAAAVLRAIDEGRSGLPPKRPRDWKRLLGLVAVVVAVAAVAGVMVARASGQRDSGDVITGGTSPNQVSTLLSEGRSFLEVSDFGEASKRYLSVLDIDPNNVEALTYAGWVLAASTQSMGNQAAIEGVLTKARQFLDKAVEIDPTYADSQCFLAIIATVFEDDLVTGADREQQCLANNPSADMRGLIDAYVTPALQATPESSPDSTSPDGTRPDGTSPVTNPVTATTG